MSSEFYEITSAQAENEEQLRVKREKAEIH